MLPTFPSWPWFTYVALAVCGVFVVGIWLALVLGIMRGVVAVFLGGWRGLVAVCQWVFGLPLTSGGTAHFARRYEVEQGYWEGLGCLLRAMHTPIFYVNRMGDTCS